MTLSAAASGTFSLAGELIVNRLGFGSMQLTGTGVWGEPADPDECVRVLRRAVELGVTLIDTADSYGPFVAERLIRRALHPYPDDLVIATKAGLTRPGPGEWVPNGHPDHLRARVHLSLKNLGVDRIDLIQLHRVDRAVPLEDQVGTLKELQDEGLVGHIGLSEVGITQLEAASEVAPIVSVQNRYNLTDRRSEELLDYAEEHQIGFMPWFPLATGTLAGPGSVLSEIAQRRSTTPSQLALAWLLRRSTVMLPIPGTSSVAHLEDNVSAAAIELTEDEVREIGQLAG